MNEKRLPYDDEETQVIPPNGDATGGSAEAVRRLEETYGDTDMDPNRDDQRDAHHGELDDIV
jgi:hypothetical protein